MIKKERIDENSICFVFFVFLNYFTYTNCNEKSTDFRENVQDNTQAENV